MKRLLLLLPLALSACSSDPEPAPKPGPTPAPSTLRWRLEPGSAFGFKLTSTMKSQRGSRSEEWKMVFEGTIVIDDVIDSSATGHITFTRVEGRFASGGDPISATVPAAELAGRQETCTLSTRGELGIMAPFTLGRRLDLSENFRDLFLLLPDEAVESWPVDRQGQRVAMKVNDADARPGFLILDGTPVPPDDEADIPRGRVVAVFDIKVGCVTKVSEDLEFVETRKVAGETVRTKRLLQRRVELQPLR